jgi:hypothetical protein
MFAGNYPTDQALLIDLVDCHAIGLLAIRKPRDELLVDHNPAAQGGTVNMIAPTRMCRSEKEITFRLPFASGGCI